MSKQDLNRTEEMVSVPVLGPE